VDDPPAPPARLTDGADPVPHRWRNLATLGGVTVVDSTETSVITTLFPTIADALRLSSGQLGFLAAMGRVVAMPFGFGWVWLAARTSRRTSLVSATVLGGVFGVAGGFSTGYAQLLVANTLMAACIVGAAPIAHALIGDSFADAQRSRAIGYYFGATTLLASLVGPALAQLAGVEDGWRYGLWVAGGISVAAGVVVRVVLRDPGVGAAEQTPPGPGQRDRRGAPVTVRTVLAVFAIPTFALLMVSRLMSTQLLISVFGIQFLVQERGFTNATAALVLLPYGAGYAVGAVTGGWVVAALDRRWPDNGRVALLQVAQLAFAAAAYVGTQLDHHLAGYGVWVALMGLTQALNPAANRPLVMSIVPPQLRALAFAIFLSVVDTLASAGFTVLAGLVADDFSLQVAFFWILVVVTAVNGLWLGLLHRTYARDRDQAARQPPAGGIGSASATRQRGASKGSAKNWVS
jgi:predicted MFS family arabinose efflux permease